MRCSDASRRLTANSANSPEFLSQLPEVQEEWPEFRHECRLQPPSAARWEPCVNRRRVNTGVKVFTAGSG